MTKTRTTCPVWNCSPIVKFKEFRHSARLRHDLVIRRGPDLIERSDGLLCLLLPLNAIRSAWGTGLRR